MNKRDEYRWQRSRVQILHSGGSTIVSYPVDHQSTAQDWRKEKVFSPPAGTHRDAQTFAKEVAKELADRAMASRATD